MTEKTRIIVDHNNQKEISKVFKCTKSMVSQALRGKSQSELAKKIRYVAVSQYGGQEIEIKQPTKQ